MAQNNQGRMPENLRKQLSLAVRSIQWSYAIFWSISATQPGVLEWGDGYYNGDIKTRKTIQAVEIKADELGLQRSKQLRELYDSLAAGESSPQSKRPSTSLSPEDLSDTEWYYLVCMSFVFDIGEGLPGRTLATGQPIWLCNAPYADSKAFSRSLLAKSASIQTIVCFPFSGGVIELGTTELVVEDLSLIQHVESSFLEMPYSIIGATNADRGIGDKRSEEGLDFDTVFGTKLIPVIGELDVTSPNISSSGFDPGHLPEDPFLIEGTNGMASQVQSWQFVDDEFSNGGAHCSMNSSDCISQTLVEPVKVVSVLKGEKINDHCDPEDVGPVEPRSDDLHYQNVLSSLLKSHQQLMLGPRFRRGRQESSFSSWKKEGILNLQKPSRTPQRILKKILFEVPRKHGFLNCPEENAKKNGVSRPESDQIGPTHVLSERTEGELISERFYALKSIIPSIGKVDQVTLLDDTIDYLKDLKRRVEELESVREEPIGLVPKSRKKSQEAFERTSDNCDHIKSGFSKRPPGGKRKVRDADEMGELEIEQREGSIDNNLTVRIKGKGVEMEIRCDWREGVLLEIMEALSDLRLDSQSVQSSNVDGVLSLKINCKYRGSTTLSVGIVRQALQRVVRSS
ncbi:transcription factor EGL1 [Punica granatum]|uniref:Transcription factor EGL1 n=1 Tax=Punica granatum TaxID=22663 RepID=A0A6P8DN82_PUNGR|nr:transcription factor EGL1 [Punica granatum]XP_031394798.1 transcription factor EGL1 [Punica granatum]